MIWVWIVVVTVAAVTVFMAMPFKRLITDVGVSANRSRLIIASPNISDHWKEKSLVLHALRMLKSAFGVLVCLAAPAATLAAGVGLAELLGGNAWGAFSSWPGILLSTFVAFAAAAALLRLDLVRRNGPYSTLQKLLHYVVLGPDWMCEALFDIERRRVGPASPGVIEGSHVFVIGLARSGTTSLMRAVHSYAAFGTLTYADMPFVLAPSFWSGIKGEVKTGDAKGRAHDDGILVDQESPEAFEEVFWRCLAGDKYLFDDHLRSHSIGPELTARFRDYVGAILLHTDAERYLSKNNNNVLRIDGILNALPNAVVLAPYREPLQQAASLLRQHQLFSAQQTESRFARNYMRWLGHHEFGLDQRPMRFGATPQAPNPALYDATTLEHWLACWVTVYDKLLVAARTKPNRVILVGYEMLCDERETVWHSLCNRLGLEATPTPSFKRARTHSVAHVDEVLLQRSTKLYSELEVQGRRQNGLA